MRAPVGLVNARTAENRAGSPGPAVPPGRGSVVFEYGNAKLASKIASVRQSMLSFIDAVEMAEKV